MDTQRLILFVVFSFSLLLLWEAWQTKDQAPQTQATAQQAAKPADGVPAATALTLSWLFFVPLSHTLVFAPGHGWIDGLPQAGLGALGGWLALMSYAMLLGLAMLWRWRSGRWRLIRLARGS